MRLAKPMGHDYDVREGEVVKVNLGAFVWQVRQGPCPCLTVRYCRHFFVRACFTIPAATAPFPAECARAGELRCGFLSRREEGLRSRLGSRSSATARTARGMTGPAPALRVARALTYHTRSSSLTCALLLLLPRYERPGRGNSGKRQISDFPASIPACKRAGHEHTHAQPSALRTVGGL